MFKVEITNKDCEMIGNIDDILTGLSMYVNILHNEMNIPKKNIDIAIKVGLMTEKEKEDLKQEQLKKNKEIDKKLEQILKKIFN